MSALNPFESGKQKVIPAVLIYPRYKNEVLMLCRKDGKWNGPGGKLELNESVVEAAARELKEETGIELGSHDFKLIGILYFPNFKEQKNEDWHCSVFEARIPAIVRKSWPKTTKEVEEGTLHWVNEKEVGGLPLWPGDRHFLPWVFRREPFFGTFWYQNGEVKKFEISAIGN